VDEVVQAADFGRGHRVRFAQAAGDARDASALLDRQRGVEGLPKVLAHREHAVVRQQHCPVAAEPPCHGRTRVVPRGRHVVDDPHGATEETGRLGQEGRDVDVEG